MRKRKIVKHGNSYYILLSPADMEDFDLKVGKEVDIERVITNF